MSDPKPAPKTKIKTPEKPVDHVFPNGTIHSVKPADAPDGARRAKPRDYAIAGVPAR